MSFPSTQCISEDVSNGSLPIINESMSLEKHEEQIGKTELFNDPEVVKECFENENAEFIIKRETHYSQCLSEDMTNEDANLKGIISPEPDINYSVSYGDCTGEYSGGITTSVKSNEHYPTNEVDTPEVSNSTISSMTGFTPDECCTYELLKSNVHHQVDISTTEDYLAEDSMPSNLNVTCLTSSIEISEEYLSLDCKVACIKNDTDGCWMNTDIKNEPDYSTDSYTDINESSVCKATTALNIYPESKDFQDEHSYSKYAFECNGMDEQVAQNCDKSQNETTISEIRQFKKKNRYQDMCYYCRSLVSNFARHIYRNHPNEGEVKQIFSKPTCSKERKELITLLRKRGNFLASRNRPYKPVRKPNFPYNNNCVPCPHCLGYYSRKLLWRHKKICATKAVHKTLSYVILKNPAIDSLLQEKVFPNMRPDEISLVAQTDSLICDFGMRCITHIHKTQSKNFIHITSRRMRELARLLMEVMELEPSITSLFQVLQPNHYNLLVKVTKNIAHFDESNGTSSLALALNIGTSLKQCCNVVLKKRDFYFPTSADEETSNLINELVNTITTRWRFEFSTKKTKIRRKKSRNSSLAYESTVDSESNINLIDDIIKEETNVGQTIECDFESSHFELLDNDVMSNKTSNCLMLNKATQTEPCKVYLIKNPTAETSCVQINRSLKTNKKKRVLQLWTQEQKNVVKSYFTEHIKDKKAPKRHECDQLKEKYPELLSNKNWLKIKVYIQNVYTNKCK